MRTEIRRRQRENRYLDGMSNEPEDKIDWSKHVPELHDAIEQLKEGDRSVIVMRFFRGMSLAEVGESLGLSADAARMRLNRALDHLGGHLSERGIVSTSAALAVALPMHASVTAPVGLAGVISASALTAGAGVVVAKAAGAGALMIFMKTKMITVGLCIAAAAVAGGGIYFAMQRGGGELGSPQKSTVAHQEKFSLQSLSAKPTEREEKSESRRTMGKDDVVEVFAFSPLVDDRYREKAKKFLTVMAFKASVMQGEEKEGVTGEADSKKLALRLKLDPEQTAQVTEVIMENEKARQSDKLNVRKLWEIRPELAVELGALDLMADEIKNPSPELEEYAEQLQSEAKRAFGVDPDAEIPSYWQNNEELHEQLNDILDPQQQEELASYLEEQTNRRREARAYKKANKLASQLGLDNADRTELYEFLYENPKASNQEISEILAPELRPLIQSE